jgi:NAD(P)-dependent dehydrogenase (short-subunit alcohol dehydrogenase family)
MPGVRFLLAFPLWSVLIEALLPNRQPHACRRPNRRCARWTASISSSSTNDNDQKANAVVTRRGAFAATGGAAAAGLQWRCFSGGISSRSAAAVAGAFGAEAAAAAAYAPAAGSMAGKTVLITGASSGLGFESAKRLFHAGATVVMACRSRERGEAARATILGQQQQQQQQQQEEEESGGAVGGEVDVLPLDLSSLASVRACVAAFKARYPKLHVLLNNAGVMAVPEWRATAEGFEYTLGVNYLGHFLLTTLLLDRLRRTAGGSRVINVASAAHLGGGALDPSKDLSVVLPSSSLSLSSSTTTTESGSSSGGGGGGGRSGDFDPWEAYCKSKLASVLFTQELQRRIDVTGVLQVSGQVVLPSKAAPPPPDVGAPVQAPSQNAVIGFGDVACFCLHPGPTKGTGLGRYLTTGGTNITSSGDDYGASFWGVPEAIADGGRGVVKVTGRKTAAAAAATAAAAQSVEQGASTQVFLASAPPEMLLGGRGAYFDEDQRLRVASSKARRRSSSGSGSSGDGDEEEEEDQPVSEYALVTPPTSGGGVGRAAGGDGAWARVVVNDLYSEERAAALWAASEKAVKEAVPLARSVPITRKQRKRGVAEVVRRQETPSGETTPTSPAAREANAHRVNAPPIGLIQPLP